MERKLKKGALACLIIGILVIVLGLYFLLSGGKGNKYTIYFDTNGGSLVDNQEVNENETVSVPPTPTKEGAIFARWEKDGEEYDFTSKVTQSFTLKATWVASEDQPKYKISFTVNGNTKELEVSSASEINIDTLGFEEKDGYELKWYSNGKEYDMETPITEDVKLEGKYVKVSSLTVKFNSSGGSSVKSQNVKSGETAVEPTDVTYEGFILNGWYLNNKKYDFSTPVTKSITLVAKWDEDTSYTRYTVKFDSDGGSKVSDQRVIENKTATAPKNPTKDGYKFVEWQLKDKKYDFKTKVTADITLKAKWEENKQYTVTFDNNGTKTTVKVTAGEKVSKPTDPTRSGYTFVEWLLDNKTYDFNTPVNAPITLTARFVVNSSTPTPTPKPTTAPTATPTPTAKPTATPTPTPTPTPTATAVAYRYTVTATKGDSMASTDSILKVYRNGSQISFNEIKAGSDGVHLCSGSNPVVQTSDYESETSFIVILTDGTSVTATKG